MNDTEFEQWILDGKLVKLLASKSKIGRGKHYGKKITIEIYESTNKNLFNLIKDIKNNSETYMWDYHIEQQSNRYVVSSNKWKENLIMHFTTLYLLQNEELENISTGLIEEDFAERFCYSCGETTPRYRYWCDWFKIGGRWVDIIQAKKGIKGTPSWGYSEAELEKIRKSKTHFSIVNIKDITRKIKKENIYSIATKSRIYCGEDYASDYEKAKYDKLLEKINNKSIDGVIALIDCHD